MPVDDDMGILLVGRSRIRGENVTVCIDAPGHQGTHDSAAETATLDSISSETPLPATLTSGSFVPRLSPSNEFPSTRCPVTTYANPAGVEALLAPPVASSAVIAGVTSRAPAVSDSAKEVLNPLF